MLAVARLPQRSVSILIYCPGGPEKRKRGTGKAFKGSGSPRDEEVARLKPELARLKKERDFLREAAVFFAEESS